MFSKPETLVDENLLHHSAALELWKDWKIHYCGFLLSFHFPQRSSRDFHEFFSPAHKYLIFTIWCFRYVLLIIDGKSGGALIVNFSRHFDLCTILNNFSLRMLKFCHEFRFSVQRFMLVAGISHTETWGD